MRWEHISPNTTVDVPRMVPTSTVVVHYLQFSICFDRGSKKWCGEQMGHRGQKHKLCYASWKKARFQVCKEQFTSVTQGPLVFIYFLCPPLPPQHQLVNGEQRLLISFLEKLLINVYYHQIFIKPNEFKLCMYFNELKYYWGVFQQ